MGTPPNTPPPNPNQQPLMEIACTSCQTKMIVRQPIPRIFNAPDVSAIVFTHTRLDKCPQCGCPHLCLLSGIDPEGHVLFMWHPVEAKQPGILAPTPENMQSAMLAKQINDSKKKTN